MVWVTVGNHREEELISGRWKWKVACGVYGCGQGTEETTLCADWTSPWLWEEEDKPGGKEETSGEGAADLKSRGGAECREGIGKATSCQQWKKGLKSQVSSAWCEVNPALNAQKRRQGSFSPGWREIGKDKWRRKLRSDTWHPSHEEGALRAYRLCRWLGV